VTVTLCTRCVLAGEPGSDCRVLAQAKSDGLITGPYFWNSLANAGLKLERARLFGRGGELTSADAQFRKLLSQLPEQDQKSMLDAIRGAMR
jgi:hypothetical protein